MLNTRRSALSLLFVALAFLSIQTQVMASVAASGTFAGSSYQMVPGENLQTETHFTFINNFSVPINVNFVFEAPAGVSIVMPSGLVTIAANSSYRLDVIINTTVAAAEGTYLIRINGLVVPDSASGVEVSGSAGLNAELTLQIPPTQAPSVTLVSLTTSTIVVDLLNEDFEPVVILYDLDINPPTTPTPDLNASSGIRVTFSGLDENTTYTLFVSAKATNRPESEIVSVSYTTLETPPPPPDPRGDPDDSPDDSDDPLPGETEDPIPPSEPDPVPPPPTGGFSFTNVLFIELSSQSIQVPVFDEFIAPEMNAYVSIRAGIRETSRIDLTNRVVVTGTVNSSVIGRYELRYSVRYLTQTLTEVVEVFVVDQEAPKILSSEQITILVDDPFVYELMVTDNYDNINDLVITGFPSNVDTSNVGTQRFSVVVTDQSGNRTPFLFTVNVRERVIIPIVLSINNQEVILNAVEGLFSSESYQIEVSVMVNPPLANSPSWTRYTGQPLETVGSELIYVRLTDDRGRTLFGTLNPVTGRLVPIEPDDTVIEPDPWWRVLLRPSNLWIWLFPLGALIFSLWWFFFFLAKRRKKEEEPEEDEIIVSSDAQKEGILHDLAQEDLIELEKVTKVVSKPPTPKQSTTPKSSTPSRRAKTKSSSNAKFNLDGSTKSSSKTKKKNSSD